MPGRDHRVLLLALSGVRIKDRELRELGMTLPGFIERGETIASLPSLGLLTLAAYSPESWEVAYREVDVPSADLAEEIAREGFDLVAISALSARIFEAYALSDELRARGVRVALGGLHASALPDEARKHADAVVVGQGEAVWGRLLTDCENGAPEPVYRTERNHRLLRLDTPIPRYDLLNVDAYNRITLQTSRGCPFDCSFCGASRTISGYQLKPLAQVERELAAITSLWKRPFIELADDNSFASKGRGRELSRLLGASGARWFTETDLSVADDPALLEALAESGCAQLLIGLESASSASLEGLDSQRFKRTEWDHHARKIERIQAHGISVNGCFVLGFDDDEVDVFENTLRRSEELGLAEVQITILTPFPGTPLFTRLSTEGRLLRGAFWDECTLFDVTYEPARMSPLELREGFRWLMSELYSPSRTLQRKAIQRQCLRRQAGHRATSDEPSQTLSGS